MPVQSHRDYNPSTKQLALLKALADMKKRHGSIPYQAAKVLAEHLFNTGRGARILLEMRNAGLIQTTDTEVTLSSRRQDADNASEEELKRLPEEWCDNLMSHIHAGVRDLKVSHLRHSANNPAVLVRGQFVDVTARAQPHVPPPRVHRNVPQPRHPTVGFQAPPPPPRGGDRPARRPTRPQSSLPE